MIRTGPPSPKADFHRSLSWTSQEGDRPGPLLSKETGGAERPWDNSIRTASFGSVAASRSPLNPFPAHPHEVLQVMDLRDSLGNPAPADTVCVSDVLLGKSVENRRQRSLSPGFTRSFGSKSQEKAGQENEFDGRVTREAAERERVELERILLLMTANLEVARERIKTCQRLCTSVPLASLQVGTLKDCGVLVCQLEDASEHASQEAVEMHMLVESMREAAAARVERAMEQDYSSGQSGIANLMNSSFRSILSRSSAAHAKQSAAAERSASPRKYTYEELKQISPGLNPVGLAPDAGGSFRSGAMSPRASWHVSEYVCISAWVRRDGKNDAP
jgi:hypothetical protein